LIVMGLRIEVIPGESFLHKLDPRPKFLLFLFITVIVIYFTDPIYVGAIMVAVLLLTRACDISVRKTAVIVKASSPLLVVYGLINVVLGPANSVAAKTLSNILFYLVPIMNWFPVTPQGIVQSIAIVIRYAIVVYLLQLVLFTTPVVDIVLALVKWKFPSSLALGTSIGFNFVPVFMNTASSIMDAQACRGWKGLKSGNLADRIRALPVLLVPLFLHGIESAQKIAVAIEAKGFGYDLPKRTYSREIRLRTVDYATLVIEVILFAVSTVLWYTGYGTYMFTYSLLAGLRI
jgi:energy-coupling factor transport system permease protein